MQELLCPWRSSLHLYSHHSPDSSNQHVRMLLSTDRRIILIENACYIFGARYGNSLSRSLGRMYSSCLGCFLFSSKFSTDSWSLSSGKYATMIFAMIKLAEGHPNVDDTQFLEHLRTTPREKNWLEGGFYFWGWFLVVFRCSIPNALPKSEYLLLTNCRLWSVLIIFVEPNLEIQSLVIVWTIASEVH